MKEKFNLYKEKILNFWGKRSSKQKGVLITSAVLFVFLIAAGSYLANSSNMVPLYKDLSLQEVGKIKEELDVRGVKYELQSAGKTILVPEETADALLVDLAAQGLPSSGSIDYSFFSDNTSWGMTDDEFRVIELDAIQTELGELIKSIEGIDDANVMLNMPADPVFVSDQAAESSASIVLQTAPGYQLEDGQIQSLYHLVSKTIPNLTNENIVIMNQFFEYFDLNNSNNPSNGDLYASQQDIKKDIERDIQRRVQQMVGMMVGNDKVIASVTADIDFTQEQRTEELVTPVDEETMEGLPVSIETIQETYSGEPPEGGVAGTGEDDVTNYPAAEGEGQGDYELVKESVNNEFNRIKKDIVESPYKIRDLGIQVAIDSSKDVEEGEEPAFLSAAEQATVQEGISSILNSIIATSVNKEYGEIVPEEKASIVFQAFNNQQTEKTTSGFQIPIWIYVVGGILLVFIVALVWMLIRKNSNKEETEYEEENIIEHFNPVPDLGEEIENESTIRTKQLEKMAKDKPEDFAKLLRSWLSEE